MLSRIERDVHIMHFSPSTSPPSAPDITIDEIFNLIEKNWKKSDSVAFLDIAGKMNSATDDSKNENIVPGSAIFIADMNIDASKSTVSMLITRGDPNASHPAYIKLGNPNIRYSRPNQDEVQGFSAHIAISLKKVVSEPNRFRVILERVPVTSKTIISLYLNWLLKKLSRSC